MTTMTLLKYFAAAIVGAAGTGIGLNEAYFKPKTQKLEMLVVVEQNARKQLQDALKGYSIPVGDGLLKMSIQDDGRPVLWNKLQSKVVGIEELSRGYTLVKR